MWARVIRSRGAPPTTLTGLIRKCHRSKERHKSNSDMISLAQLEYDLHPSVEIIQQ